MCLLIHIKFLFMITIGTAGFVSLEVLTADSSFLCSASFVIMVIYMTT